MAVLRLAVLVEATGCRAVVRDSPTGIGFARPPGGGLAGAGITVQAVLLGRTARVGRVVVRRAPLDRRTKR